MYQQSILNSQSHFSSTSSASPRSIRNNNLYYKKRNNNDAHKISIHKEFEEFENALRNCQLSNYSYRTKVKFFKIAFGFLIIAISSFIMVWNEKTAAEMSQLYDEGLGTIQVLEDEFQILPENEGKLVYVNGYLSMDEPLEEYPYGVSIYAVKLKRRVQLYQWVEERILSTDFEKPPFRYNKIWKDKLVNSSDFALPLGHENPKELPLTSEIRIHSDVKLGGFSLGPELKDKFNNFIQFTSGERPYNHQQIKMHMGLYYHSSDIWSPMVGDIRVQFSFAGAAETFISVIAMQSEEELRPFYTKSALEIMHLYEGRINHLEIFRNAYSSFIFRSWNIRIIVWIALNVGSFLAMKTLTHLNRRNHIIKNLLSLGPFKLCLILSSSISFCLIGAAWLSHKPVFGFLLATLSCCLVLYYLIVPTPDNENGNYKNSAKTKTSASNTRKNFNSRFNSSRSKQNTQQKSKQSKD